MSLSAQPQEIGQRLLGEYPGKDDDESFGNWADEAYSLLHNSHCGLELLTNPFEVVTQFAEKGFWTQAVDLGG